MYKTVLIILSLGFESNLSILENGFGSGLNQFGVQFSGWMLGVGMLPSLAVGALTLILFYRKNAVSFWVYLSATVFTTGGILNVLASLPVLAKSARTNASPFQILTATNITLVVLFFVKVLICWMMWQLLKRDKITYTR